MDTKAELKKLADDRRARDALDVAIRSRRDALERYLKVRFDEAWERRFNPSGSTFGLKKYSIVGVIGSDAPRVHLYHVGNRQLTDTGVWLEYEASRYKVYPFQLRPIAPPCDESILRDFMSAFEAETGLPVKHVIVEVLDKPERLKTVDDVRAHYGDGFEVLEEGKVWYTGWDIADNYVIGRLGGRYVARYSTDGHGFGMAHEARTVEEFGLFFNFLDAHGYGGVRQRHQKAVAEANGGILHE